MLPTSAKSRFFSSSNKGVQFLRRLDNRIFDMIMSTGSAWVIIVSIWAVSIYLMVNFFLPGRVSANDFLYIGQPILWSSLTLLAWLGWRYGLVERPNLTWPLAITAFLLALSQIAVLAITGLLLGFGYSPYDHQFGAVLRNMLYVGTLLAAFELMRAYLTSQFKQRHPWISFILVSLFISILRIAPAAFGQFDNIQSSIQLIGERLLPTLAQNMLATLLALLGGPLPSIIYLGTLQLFEWLSPILPNPGWFVIAFVGTVIPAYGMVIVYNQFVAEPDEEREQSEVAPGRSSLTSWAVVALFTLVHGWLQHRPVRGSSQPVGSGSMTPNLMVGDIVVAREAPIETVKVGDVITFYQEGVTIVHRVVEIQNNAGKITFITRGDANDSVDPPVLGRKL